MKGTCAACGKERPIEELHARLAVPRAIESAEAFCADNPTCLERLQGPRCPCCLGLQDSCGCTDMKNGAFCAFCLRCHEHCLGKPCTSMASDTAPNPAYVPP